MYVYKYWTPYRVANLAPSCAKSSQATDVRGHEFGHGILRINIILKRGLSKF